MLSKAKTCKYMLYLLEETQYKVTSTDLNTAQETTNGTYVTIRGRYRGKKIRSETYVKLAYVPKPLKTICQWYS